MIRERLITKAFTQFKTQGCIDLDTAAGLMEQGVIIEKLERQFLKALSLG